MSYTQPLHPFNDCYTACDCVWPTCEFCTEREGANEYDNSNICDECLMVKLDSYDDEYGESLDLQYFNAIDGRIR